jgi:hypothetical protein
VEKLAGLEGLLVQGATRGAYGDAEGDAGVAELFEGGEPQRQLTPQGEAHDRGREVELVDEDLSVQPARSHGSQQGATEQVVVRGAASPEDLRQRGSCAVELHGHDASRRHVDAVRATPILHELQGAGCRRPVKGTEQIAEGRRPESSGQLHDPAIVSVAVAGGPTSWQPAR